MIAIDLSKRQALDADPKGIQQVSFTGNLDQSGNTTMFFIIKEAKKKKKKKNLVEFSQGTVRVLYIYFVLT